MNKTPVAKVSVWTSPKLVKLGKLEDVAPRVPGGGEGTNKQS